MMEIFLGVPKTIMKIISLEGSQKREERAIGVDRHSVPLLLLGCESG
jgi:hypothetical protein